MRYFAKVISGLLAVALMAIAAPIPRSMVRPAASPLLSALRQGAQGNSLPLANPGLDNDQAARIPGKYSHHSSPARAEAISDKSTQTMRVAARSRLFASTLPPSLSQADANAASSRSPFPQLPGAILLPRRI
jgi:hypothetical protein